ncbi:uncharacterized protein MONBRDRAFT_8571 [Monosiga brevicollis MX1]|uniref:Formiminotransferase N-terminal subdomain domain-containing protein n=1 Tax=Monosiga brevicollis TaxID=81824 RepID=A9V0F7_MONBE|nr:uncharacterized protein MONBRDRAFT_8571 [Monosiga brevicollis MX1]EDQ89003.1 predicted protein [Monosiga brevicollis MX1]|eukprot:XP_001746108.1 hypothetical protein [Monosiga brevicollis MX1]
MAVAGLRQRVLALKIYLSEGRSNVVLDQLVALAEACAGVRLVDTFRDKPYHRSSLTLLSDSSPALAEAAGVIGANACKLIDMESHVASHPRLGTIDHISCHDVTAVAEGTSLVGVGHSEQAIQLVHDVGASIAAQAVPVYLYGPAHPKQRQLVDLRRALGYFDRTTPQGWCGIPPTLASALQSLPPDVRASSDSQLRHGVCTVGSGPWTTGFNIALCTSCTEDEQEAALAAVRRPGLVQAMLLPHDGHVELACNLLDADHHGPIDVLETLQKHHFRYDFSYVVGVQPSKFVQLFQGHEAAPVDTCI